MPVIASIDGPNRLIFLHADTLNAEVDPMDIYREMRTLRRTDEDLRKFDVFMQASGNISKGGGTATPKLTTLLNGTRIVPFDAEGELTIVGEIITDEGTSGLACFNRSSLTSQVDINYIPPQVEIIYVTTGGSSGPTATEIASAVWNKQTSDHEVAGSFGLMLKKILNAVRTLFGL